MAKIKVRKAMPSVTLNKTEFKKRLLAKIYDPIRSVDV